MRLIVLIGFSRGLGKALFKELLPKLQSGKTELLALGRNTEDFHEIESVSFYEIDLLNIECGTDVSTCIPKNIEQLDVIINASIIEPINTVGNLDNSLVENAAKVNLISPIKIVNELVALQRDLKFCMSVFNISSGASTNPIEGWAMYCSTKAAFKMFLDVLDKETGKLLMVKHIDPGVIDTDMQKLIRSKSIAEMKNVEQFRNFELTNKLKSPLEAASEILSLMDFDK